MIKKFFTLLCLCTLCIGSAWGEEVSFSYSDFKGQGQSGSGSAFTSKTNGNIKLGGTGYGNTSYIQIYSNGNFVIEPLNGVTITKVVLTATSNYIKTWSDNSSSSLSINGSTATWSGSYNKTLVLKNTATSQARITKIDVTYSSTTPSKTLESIAISGNPTKTAYETGESFDVTGLTVIGTYDDASTADLTSEAEWTINPATFTSTAQTSVSVTATVDGKTDTKNYNVTVSEHVVTPGTYEISLNNAFWGTNYEGSASTSQNELKLEGSSHDVTINLNNGSSTNVYITNDQTRAYNGYSLKFTVPTGYELTSIVFTQVNGKDWKGTLSADNGSMGTDNKTWSGNSNDVTISFNGTCVIEKVTVTYAEKKTLSSIAVKSAPAKTTYYVGDDFNPEGLVITTSYDDESTEDIAYTETNNDAFSFSGFNSEAVATGQEITVTYAEKSATFTVDIEEARTLIGIEVATAPTKTVYEVGDKLDLTGLVVNGIFSKGNPEPVEYTADPANGTTLDVVGTTTVTLTSVDNTELTTSFNVTVNAIVGDRLTLNETGVTGTSYTAWTDKEGVSGAKYAGRSAGGNSAIQLNDTNPNGIVSTTSGGNITKVKVVWNTSTANDRELEVYGSNIAYTGSGDLYDNTKKGTSLGTIKNGTSTELTINGKYAYVGVRSKSGAMYLTSITFVWGEKETYTRTVNTANIGTLCVPYAFEKPDYVTLYNIVGKDESKIYFEENEDAIVAGKPYLFRSSEGTITLTYTGEKATESKSSNGLVGTFEGCAIDANAGNYILSGNKLYFVDGNFNCGANRAYIHIDGIEGDAPTSAKADFTLDFNEPTGIESFSNENEDENENIYNLNGVRVNGNYKGIVIMNGKKYINK